MIEKDKVDRANQFINFGVFLIVSWIVIISAKYFLYAEYPSFNGFLARTLSYLLFGIGFYFGGKYFVKEFYSS